jgi:c-di-AMP phosphodiesterase-like protein
MHFFQIGQAVLTTHQHDLEVQDVSQMIGMVFFLVSGLLVNANWILTNLAMMGIMIGALLYYILYLDVYDTAMVFQIVMITGLHCFSTNRFEWIMKNEFIRLKLIESMNLDLENVFKHMPNGILLLDESTNQVKFANDAFCDLVFCKEQDERCLNRKI